MPLISGKAVPQFRKGSCTRAFVCPDYRKSHYTRAWGFPETGMAVTPVHRTFRYTGKIVASVFFVYRKETAENDYYHDCCGNRK